MKILLIGSGAREHALAWRLCKDESVSEVLVAPGNSGTSGQKMKNIKANNINDWLKVANEESVDLTIVGPEEPLVWGVVDAFKQDGCEILGPNAPAARIEGSKAYAKRLMNRLGIPTPESRVVYDLNKGKRVLEELDPPYVIKIDGLASGKGVFITSDREEASEAMFEYLDGLYSASSSRLLIERFVRGKELSLNVLCDGSKAQSLGTAADYKRLYDGNSGPNTGGMGACAPSEQEISGAVNVKDLIERFVDPILRYFAEQGNDYRGFLYPGLIINEEGEVLCLEYNCRMGDPETQVLAPLWQGDLAEAFLAAAQGNLRPNMLSMDDRRAVGVVLASDGYPFLYRAGREVKLPQSRNNDLVFHGALRREEGGNLSVVGGRVATCVSVRQELSFARAGAYHLIGQTDFAEGFYRHDIAA